MPAFDTQIMMSLFQLIQQSVITVLLWTRHSFRFVIDTVKKVVHSHSSQLFGPKAIPKRIMSKIQSHITLSSNAQALLQTLQPLHRVQV